MFPNGTVPQARLRCSSRRQTTCRGRRTRRGEGRRAPAISRDACGCVTAEVWMCSCRTVVSVAKSAAKPKAASKAIRRKRGLISAPSKILHPKDQVSADRALSMPPPAKRRTAARGAPKTNFLSRHKQIVLSGKSVKSCLAPFAKIFRLQFLEIRTISEPSRAHTRGVSPSSRNVGRGMRWTRRSKGECNQLRTVKSCGPGAAYAGEKSREAILRGDGDNKPAPPGRARSKP